MFFFSVPSVNDSRCFQHCIPQIQSYCHNCDFFFSSHWKMWGSSKEYKNSFYNFSSMDSMISTTWKWRPGILRVLWFPQSKHYITFYICLLSEAYPSSTHWVRGRTGHLPVRETSQMQSHDKKMARLLTLESRLKWNSQKEKSIVVEDTAVIKHRSPVRDEEAWMSPQEVPYSLEQEHSIKTLLTFA